LGAVVRPAERQKNVPARPKATKGEKSSEQKEKKKKVGRSHAPVVLKQAPNRGLVTNVSSHSGTAGGKEGGGQTNCPVFGECLALNKTTRRPEKEMVFMVSKFQNIAIGCLAHHGKGEREGLGERIRRPSSSLIMPKSKKNVPNLCKAETRERKWGGGRGKKKKVVMSGIQSILGGVRPMEERPEKKRQSQTGGRLVP